MFDRSAITEGRLIQEFGLCDLKGVYQNTSKLRAKGWLVVLFFDAGDSFSTSVVKALQGWSGELPADKVAILGVGRGDSETLKTFAAEQNVTFPIVWDFDDYVGGLYGINAVPTLFVTDARGKVLARIVGDNAGARETAKAVIVDALRAAAEAAAKAAEAAPPPAPAQQAAATPPPAPSKDPAPTGSAGAKEQTGAGAQEKSK